MGTHRTESIAGVLVRGVAAGPAFVAPPQLRPWTESQNCWPAITTAISVVDAVNVWVSYEESGHAQVAGQQH